MAAVLLQVKLFGHDWPLSFLILGISASMLFGLQEIAVAMSDPFGTDASDFDTHKLCADAYANTVAYIKAKQAPLGKGGKLATNPLRDKIVFSVRKDSA
jgi:predicted membrane chloride channel (bestrophin family)